MHPRDCPPGTSNSDLRVAKCPPCEAGKYQPLTGEGACLACTPGHYCPQGATEPRACPGGTYSAAYGVGSADECRPCPPGSACLAGVLKPTPCAAGSFASDARASACEYCPAGSFQEQTSATSCKLCAAGYVSDERGRLRCTPCAPGTEAQHEGLRRCTDCAAGKFAADEATVRCMPCEPGKYQPVNKQKTCRMCEAGKSIATSGALECAQCQPGKYMALEGRAECLSCPRGKKNPLAGMRECEPCGPGEASPTGYTQPQCQSCGLSDPSQQTAVTGLASSYGAYAPFGIACPNAALLGTLPGFWAERLLTDANVNVTRAFACTPAAACLGGPDSKCAPGHMGRLCLTCQVGFAPNARGLCESISAVGDDAGMAPPPAPVFANVTRVETVTQLVSTPAVTASYFLSADLSEFDANRQAGLTARLAALYAVDPANVTISFSAGSVLVRVSVAILDPFYASALAVTINGLNDSVVGGALGLAVSRVGTVENTTVILPRQVQVVVTEQVVAPGRPPPPALPPLAEGWGLEVALLVLLSLTVVLGFALVLVTFCWLRCTLPQLELDEPSPAVQEVEQAVNGVALAAELLAPVDTPEPEETPKVTRRRSVRFTPDVVKDTLELPARGSREATMPIAMQAGGSLPPSPLPPPLPPPVRQGAAEAPPKAQLATAPAMPSVPPPVPTPTLLPAPDGESAGAGSVSSPPPSPPVSPATPPSTVAFTPLLASQRAGFIHREVDESAAPFPFADYLATELSETYGLRAAVERPGDGQAQLGQAPFALFCLSANFFSDARSVGLLRAALAARKPLILIRMPYARWGASKDLELPDHFWNPEAIPYTPDLAPAFAEDVILWELEYVAACFTDVLTVLVNRLGHEARRYIDINGATLRLAEAENAALAQVGRIRPTEVSLSRRWDGEGGKEYDIYLCHKLDEGCKTALSLYNGLSMLHYKPYLGRLGLSSDAEIREAMRASGTFVILLTGGIVESYWCALELITAVELHEQGVLDLVLVPVQGARFYPDPVGMSGTTVGLPTGEMMMKNYAVWFPELPEATYEAILRLFGGGAYTQTRLVQHSLTHYKAFERTLLARVGMSISCRVQVKQLLAKQSAKLLVEPGVISKVTELVLMVDEANCLQQQLGAPARYSVLPGKATNPMSRATAFLQDALKLHIVTAVDNSTLKRVATRLDAPAADAPAESRLELHVQEVLEGSSLFVKPLRRSYIATPKAADIDIDGDGKLDYAEMLQFAARRKQEEDDGQTVRHITIDEFPRMLRLLRLRAEENDALPPSVPPPGAPEAFALWASTADLIAVRMALGETTITRQLLKPLTAIVKVVLGYAQVAGSFVYTFSAPQLIWPLSFLTVAERFAWLNIEVIFSTGTVASLRDTFDLERHATGRAVRDFLADLDYANSTCAFLLATTAFFAALPASAYLITLAASRRYLREALVDRSVAMLVFAAFTLYPGIMVRLSRLFVPRNLAGAQVLKADPRLDYDELAWAQIFALVYFVLFGLGIPLAFGAQLYLAKRRAERTLPTDTPAARAERAYEIRRDRLRYGLLDALYAGPCWWWEAYEMVRKLFLVGVLLAVLPGTVLQLWMCVLVCLFALVLTTFVNPFTHGKVNALNFISMICLLLIAAIGLGYHVDYAGVHKSSMANIEYILPSVLVALLCAPLAAAAAVALLAILDAAANRREALAEWAALPAPMRDEVPLVCRRQEERRLRDEFRQRHAAMMGSKASQPNLRKLERTVRLREEAMAHIRQDSLREHERKKMGEETDDAMKPDSKSAPQLSPPPIPAVEGVAAPPRPSMAAVPAGNVEARLDAGGGTLRLILHSAAALAPSSPGAADANWYAVVRTGVSERRSQSRKATATDEPVWEETLDFATGATLRELLTVGMQLYLVDAPEFAWPADSTEHIELRMEELREMTATTLTAALPAGGEVTLSLVWLEGGLEA